ncbi:D-xylose ABC transporter substrate-binding protein [Atribacter laminatus]|uniref:D-xylose-binding periplasmic protein n=1 Tax=Atribacter laminatus TaxID=2847778 RepID=A0A7T1AK72_ATRLM|nr:D-xylose ABC transporter substrate-binding protein [Atribacter laminatus]QPM67430.1 D-xylose-binding periplasmic protein [Atribacter laminatus]
MKKNIWTKIIGLVILTLVLFSSIQFALAEEGKTITIGVSVGDLRLERWKRDMDYMVARAKELGATVYAVSADGDEQKQIADVENMLTKGIDVLIALPTNSKTLAPAVEAAHADNIKVIAYDRIIENADLDYYITFDMLGVGKLQAQYLLDRMPKGRYFLLAGPKTDNNALLFREGQMMVLQSYIDKGDVVVVGDQWAEGWLSENAMQLSEDVLTANNNQIDAILASNDSTANGAIQALLEQDLAGKVLITGQDADLAACQRIVAGTQTMSVYKPLPKLAAAAIDLAFNIVQGKTIETNATYNNGQKDVPSINLEIIAVDQSNILETVIADGFHSFEDVYKNVPEDQRPEWPKE